MNKKLLVSVVAGIIVVALLVGGWFIFSAVKSPEQPSVNGKASPTASNNNGNATDNPTPTPNETYKDVEKDLEEIKDKSDNFKDVKAVEFFTEEDTKAALQVSYDYAETALTNRYFLSGQWSKDGFNLSHLDATYGQYFNKELRAKINAWDDSNNGANLKSEDLLPLVFYVADNGEVAPSKYCAFGNPGTDEKVTTTAPEGAISCPITGLTVSDMKYEEAKSGETPAIKVAFTASTEIPVTITAGNKDAKTVITYEYILVLVQNTYQAESTNPQPFVISDYDIKVLASKVEPLDG